MSKMIMVFIQKQMVIMVGFGRQLALNLVKKDKSKGSNRVKFKRAGWNDEFLIKLIAKN